MASIEFAGFVYDGSGAAVSNATINLYDRNTVTPVRATTTTNASGYWTITHATEGRFDVEIVNGTTTRRIKYDSAIQLQELETANLLVRNPANTFKYDIVPAAITADRILNLPLITATRTLVANNTALADNESIIFGTGADASILYDGTNLVVNPILVGAGVFDLAAGILELNNAVRFDTGVAMVAASYSIGRDADATNQLHYNVPTGATYEWSINDVAEVVLSATDLNLNANTLSNVGNAGNDWTANALVINSANSGAINEINIINSSNTASSRAYLYIAVGGSSAGDPFVYIEESGGHDMVFGLDVSSSVFAWSASAALGTNDIIRVTDAIPPVITYNTTHPTGTFDWWCEACDWHGATKPDRCPSCNSRAVVWHDDTLALVPVLENLNGQWLTGREPGVQHLARLGVMEISENNDGTPWIGINLHTAQWYTWAMIVQERAYSNRLEARIAALEAA